MPKRAFIILVHSNNDYWWQKINFGKGQLFLRFFSFDLTQYSNFKSHQQCSNIKTLAIKTRGGNRFEIWKPVREGSYHAQSRRAVCVFHHLRREVEIFGREIGDNFVWLGKSRKQKESVKGWKRELWRGRKLLKLSVISLSHTEAHPNASASAKS